MTSIRQGSFVTRHLGTLVAFLIWTAGLVYTHGVNTAKVSVLEAEISKLQANESTISQTKWIVDQHERSLSEMKSEQKLHGVNIAEIKLDVRLVAEWVKEQKLKHKSELEDELSSRSNP